MNGIAVGGKMIGPGEPCFVIAEAGVNHNGDLERAFELVRVAARAGADAVKFQLYRAVEQVSKAAMTADYQKSNTGATSMLEMSKSYDLPWEAHRQIVEVCREEKIHYMASCFDPDAVDFLISIGGDAIKVGSGEITNLPLLRHMSSTGLPVLLSTGMSTMGEVEDAVRAIREAGESPLALFHCVSNYPATIETINLRAMSTLAAAFAVPVGYSDHTMGATVSVTAVALGATMVEKHFTTDRTLPGPDHAMSLGPEDLRSFVQAIRDAESALGDGVKRPQPEELPVRTVARRSVVTRRAIRAGEQIEADALTLKRPATGVEPRDIDKLIGRIAAVDIEEDVPLRWEMLR